LLYIVGICVSIMLGSIKNNLHQLSNSNYMYKISILGYTKWWLTKNNLWW